MSGWGTARRAPIAVQKKGRKQVERKPRKPGPDPEVVKIEGDWKDAVRKALKKGKPPAESGPE